MAKEDFCFTYYDGDATRDTTHMNRLERGAYHDIIISQRKFGHLTIDQIKKILGKDFSECWPSIELIMKCVDGKYFIEWLENSLIKMRKHAKKQSNNKLGKTKNNQTESKQEPNQNQTNPLEDGNENGNEVEEKLKEAESKIEIFESLFEDAIYVEQLSMTHVGKDLKQAFEECYTHHSNGPNPPTELWQWRQKLNTWLTIKKVDKSNGNGFKNKQQDNLNGLIEDFGSRVVGGNS